jgi:cobalt-zinc-cadmium resistance protein CzcA
MIRALVDFALNNRFLITAAAVLLLIWGAISFHQLPVEAYPDVANNYVQIITQWPGRAAEEVEQQVTIPIEIVVNGIPHLDHLRSTSLFGLSSVMLIFDDQSSNDLNRQKVLERLSQVSLAAGLQPQIGADYSPVGQIYWYTLKSTNPSYDLMELKTLQDWVLEKQFKSVPNVVDVVSFGGITREYQVRIDPDKLVSYGISLPQVEQQLANNNVNAGGSFVESGLQQINVRATGSGPQHSRHRQDSDQDSRRDSDPGSQRCIRDARHEDPVGTDWQGNPSRRRPDPRQQRRRGRNCSVAEGRQFRRNVGGHSRQGCGPERTHSAQRSDDRAFP